MKELFLLALAAAVAVGGAGLATDVATAAHGIGVAGPMTGDQGKIGGDIRNGVGLAVQKWNAASSEHRMGIPVGDDRQGAVAAEGTRLTFSPDIEENVPEARQAVLKQQAPN